MMEKEYQAGVRVAQAMALAARAAYRASDGSPEIVMPFAAAILAEAIAGTGGTSRAATLGVLLAVVEKIKGEMS